MNTRPYPFTAACTPAWRSAYQKATWLAVSTWSPEILLERSNRSNCTEAVPGKENSFGVTPFLDLGLGNSIPDTRFLHRPYISYGDVAHFEGGSELDLGSKFSVTVSGYYKLPWGPQQIFLRGGKSMSGPTKGSVSLTRDDGINLGFDYNLTRSLDLSAGYSRSVYSALNTLSFGIQVNVASLLKSHSGL